MNHLAKPSSSSHTPVLRVMMFLQFAVYGLWLPLASRFLSADPETEGGLGFNDVQISILIVFAGAFGAIFSPLVVQIADRRFAANRLLAVLLVIGGILKFITASQTTFTMWLVLSVSYTLVYMPTIALTNAIAMRHLEDPTSQYSRVRVWGTFGWIAVAWFFPAIWLMTDVSFQWLPPFFTGQNVEPVAARMLDAMRVAGVLSIGYGMFAFWILPHTPPQGGAGKKGFVLSTALTLFRRRSFAVLFGVTLLVSALHFLYFAQTSKFLAEIGLDDAYLMPAMSIGQFSEILFMAFLAFFLKRFGFAKVLWIGAFCYVLRYIIFGMVDLPLWVIVSSQALHGICFACFFAASFIYVDRVAPNEVRNSAQSLYSFAMYGLGPLLSVVLNITLSKLFSGDDGKLQASEYGPFWFSAAAFGLMAVVILAFAFRDETERGGEESRI